MRRSDHRDRKRSDERGRDRDRDRNRDRSRDRDRDRGRDRERDRDRSRDRTRDRDRDRSRERDRNMGRRRSRDEDRDRGRERESNSPKRSRSDVSPNGNVHHSHPTHGRRNGGSVRQSIDDDSRARSGAGVEEGRRGSRLPSGGGSGGGALATVKVIRDDPRDKNDRFDQVSSKPTNMNSKKGTTGQVVNLTANFFLLKKNPSWCLHNYHVDFNPNEERTPIRKAMLRVHNNVLGAYVFDGTTMWTARRLDDDPMVLCSMRDSDQETIEITIKRVSELAPGDVTYLQFYNIIIRKCLQILNFEELGRQFYDRLQAIEIPEQRLELWPGYLTTMRNYEDNLMLNVEVTHKVLRLDNCLTIMLGHRGSPNQKELMENELIGSVVMTHYNRKTYKIDDIDFSKNPSSTFDIKGNPITYAEYYLTKYNIPIGDMRQPLLVSRAKKRDIHRGNPDKIYLVPETCQMTGLTEHIRTNFQAMRLLARHLHQAPDQRLQNIQAFMRRLHSSLEIREELTKWELEFDTSPVRLQGRVVPKDTVIMGQRGGLIEQITPDDNADWKFAFRNKPMYVSKRLSNWVIIVPTRDAPGVDNLIRCMSNVGRTLGFMVQQPLETIRLSDVRIQTYINAINQAMAVHSGGIDMVFIILPNNKLELYAAVKKRCCIDFGVASQCFLGRNLSNQKGLMSIATKVVIQMNAKMGGEPWAIVNPLKSSHTMVVGFDVYHCGKKKGASVGAMVASMNKDLSRYFSTVSFHNNREELSTSLCLDMTKCVHAFSKVNGHCLPDRIIMFRDGVGEGQLKFVYDTELDEIKTSLLTIYQSYNKAPPKFTLIVVSKKINARIFLSPSGLPPRNPPPGTVVDDVITLPERWDFYLVSQHVNQGTVSPTCYNVVHDQQGLDPDKIQRFAYKMTHMYYNWSGTVAVPAPCQYAHKLAYLTGLALGSASHEKLSHHLYYL